MVPNRILTIFDIQAADNMDVRKTSSTDEQTVMFSHLGSLTIQSHGPESLKTQNLHTVRIP